MGSKWKFPNIATLFLNRKLEAEDTTCDRLGEEMLGHTLFLPATGGATLHRLGLLDKWNTSAIYCYTHPGRAQSLKGGKCYDAS